MAAIEITKMSAAGNDFILVDSVTQKVPSPLGPFIQKICTRRLSIGADGFLFIERSRPHHLKVTYYNSDGSHANLCLNGLRCTAMFAFNKVMAPKRMRIKTDAGVFNAEIVSNGVMVDLPTRPRSIKEMDFEVGETTCKGYLVDVGVPHLIIVEKWDLEEVDFVSTARSLRYHERLQPHGANVSFVKVEDEQLVRIRTYERGIEDEMLSCSSGSWAAIFALIRHRVPLLSPVQILPKCLIPLNFHFESAGKEISSMSLQGEARLIYTTTIEPEAWYWSA